MNIFQQKYNDDNSGDIFYQKYCKYKKKYIDLKQKLINQSGGYEESAKPKLILFKAEWCGHCRNFKDSWNTLQKNLNTIDFVTYDADSDESVMEEYKVQGFPTLIFQKDDKLVEFNGDRNIDNIISFVKENLN